MAECDGRGGQGGAMSKETAVQALNAIVQLHFDKTLEKKRAVDQQKKHLSTLFLLFFIFLALVFLPIPLSPRLQCRHSWIPIALLSLSHLLFYVAVAQTLRCINAFSYQRRCHKLTLGLAADRLRRLRARSATAEAECDEWADVPYQEPPETYLGKFRRNWALHFGFLLLTYAFMVSSSVAILCF